MNTSHPSHRLVQAVVAITAAMLLVSCGGTFDKVVQSHDNGNPMLIYTYKGTEKAPVLVAERMYYDDGTLQFEKLFSGHPEHPDGIWKYYFDNGQLFASADFSHETRFGQDWQFFNRDGKPYYDAPYDSVYVTDMGMFGTPTTVVFCAGIHHDVIQFYSNYTVRSAERLTNGRRNGRVIFYYPGGIPQTEGYYVDGVEEGSYTVFHPNGVPFYRGQYTAGKRTGLWEFYDEEGNLTNTKQY